MLHRPPFLAATLALSLGLGLAGCGTPGANRSLNSIHQPVVHQETLAVDLQTQGGALPAVELARLDGWLTQVGAGYGDTITVAGLAPGAVPREQLAERLARRGLMLADRTDVAETVLAPNLVRLTLTRAVATMPGCPDWSGSQAGSFGNATGAGYGCAINGNLAAMIADPADLLRGVESAGPALVPSAGQAISVHRERIPTGAEGLADISSTDD